MIYSVKLFLLLLFVNTLHSSKLNVPRVLLPLFKSSPTNFTLKVSDNGCYKWTLSRLDIIQVIPINLNKQQDCSSEVLLTTITKEFSKNTVIVFVEEISTKEVLRCDVIVDVIKTLNIVTKTRQLFVEESPERFEVRAFDDQGNEFSTLEGVQFTWKINSGSRNDVSGKNDVLRFINFKDSLYEIPTTIYNLDLQGLKGHVVLLEGVKTGTANVSVELSQFEYRHVTPAVVQLNVIANLIIEPAETYILQGDVIYFKLLQVKSGRFIQIPLPSAQYSLNIENESVAQQFRPWVVVALSLGHTKLTLSDVNSKMSNVDDATYLPSVSLNVVSPAYMNLILQPYNNWITTVHQPNAIVADLYDSNNHRIHIGPHPIVTINVERRYVVVEQARNGSYVVGYAKEVGSIHLDAEFNSVRTNENVIIPFTRLTAQADILVYATLTISPSEIAVPWDPLESLKLSYQLNIKGGDGLYQWSIANTQVAVVTQSGFVKPRSIGQTEITASMQKNQAIQTSVKVTVASPRDLKIMHNSIESEIGSPIYLSIALYYKTEINGFAQQGLFTDCTGFPFKVNVNNEDFFYNSSARVTTPPGACATIGIVGNNAGSALVTVSYESDAIFIKDVAKVSAYQPLKIVSPENAKTVLSVGAQRYVVFEGGPSSGRSEGHRIQTDYDGSTISVEDVRDSIADIERVYLVTCHAIGSSYIALKVIDQSAFKGLDDIRSKYDVQVLCRHPKSLRLYTEAVETCPLSFRSKNMVLNDRPIVLKVVIFDAEGNSFDNATSLGVKSSLTNEDLGEVGFQGIVKLKEQDRVRYRLPLYHYQVINPFSRAGSLDVTMKILNYRKTWLKKLSIDWDEKTFKIGSDLQDTITLRLVNNIHVSPESVSVFNHPKNVVKLYITYGSGYYKWTSSAENAAHITHSEASGSVDIVPLLPGAFTLIVRDECLHSDPVVANILILTISKIEVDLISKIEKGKTVDAYLKLFDSEGNTVTEQMLNLKTEVDSNIVIVDCNNAPRKRTDDRILCLISGFEIGYANLVFKAGTDNSIVRSAPVRVQVYPPLQIIPRNITLILGSVIQLTVKGGPQPDCVIEYSAENDVVVVDSMGNVLGNELGDGIVVAKAISLKSDGEKIVYSMDTTRVNVVYLEGIRIKTPLTKIRTNARMPIWVEGIPEHINPLVLASVRPSLIFKWEVSSPNLAHLNNIFDETGVKIPDSDKISMRVHAVKSGHVIINVKVVVPDSIVPLSHRGVFLDSVNVEIFDEVQEISYIYQPVMVTPNMKYQLKTNKDKVARMSYKTLVTDSSSTSVMDVDSKGLISTYNKYGFGIIQITSIEDNGFVRNSIISVQVSRIQYVMLNIVPELKVSSESSVGGLPKGIKLSFYISYHDNEGNEFTATNNNVKFLQSNLDKVRISQSDDDNNLMFELLDSGTTAIKIFDDDTSIVPDFVKMNVVTYIQPDKMKFVVGDVICFNSPTIVKDEYVCTWNSSNENSLAIDKKTGFATARSKENNIVVSYQCSNNLQIVTTADVYSLQKIEILNSSIPNITNNGKRFPISLLLINEMDDLKVWRHYFDSSLENQCVSEKGGFFYPYECELKFKEENSYDINSLFEVYPRYDVKYGHACVIVSEDFTLPAVNQMEADVILKVTWNRHQSTSTIIPFKPAVSVQNTKIMITDLNPVDIVQVTGAPTILSNVQVVPSNSKYVSVLEEDSEMKNVFKFSIYLKLAFLKEAHDDNQDLSISIISEITGQNITLPIHANVNAEHYVTPHQFTDFIMYYFKEYAFKFLLTLFVCVIVYVVGFKVYKFTYERRLDDSTFRDLSHNRNHLSPHHAYKKPSFNEIQMIYGRSPDTSLRSRRN